ncbi:unnamed protein product [Calypogeia fissa]
MRKPLFMKIPNKLMEEDNFFVQKLDATRRMGISSIQKMTVALRIMCYGSVGDAVDEYVRIEESTTISALKHFVEAVVSCFGEEYLQEPTQANIRRHMETNATRGFVGMFGSLDCTHWDWKNCLVGE